MPTRPRLLLRSSWQTGNIGDVAHAPGAVLALQRFAPEADVVLWPLRVSEREREMYREFLPDLRIVEGAIAPDGLPDTDELREEFELADLLVHGSGPSALAANDVRAWAKATGRPYGFFGVTFDPFDPPHQATLDELEAMIRALPPDYLSGDERELLDGAAFVYCRDSLSLAFLRRQGIACPVLEFGPDASFAYDLHDRDAAAAIMQEFGFRQAKVLCVIPAVRWTPYFRVHGFTPQKEHKRREAVNALHTESDMAPLRDAIVAWVREHGGQVLVCPEMIHEVELGERYLAQGYPADVQPHVRHLPRFWALPEAAAFYAQAAAVLGHECHSPILASVSGTPALYVRQPCDTVKGRMYADVGLPQSVVEVERDASEFILTWLDRVANDSDAMRAASLAASRRANDVLAHMAGTALTSAQAGVTAP